jgi:hypothetical protein
LVLFWYDQYFFIRSRGAEPKWLRRLRHRLLAVVILLNIIFLSLAVLSGYREYHRTIVAVSLGLWALFILPVIAGHSYMIRRLQSKIDEALKKGRAVKDQRYLARITMVWTVVCVIVLASIALGVAYVVILPDVLTNRDMFVGFHAVFRTACFAISLVIVIPLAWPSMLVKEEWVIADLARSDSLSGRANSYDPAGAYAPQGKSAFGATPNLILAKGSLPPAVAVAVLEPALEDSAGRVLEHGRFTAIAPSYRPLK